MLPAYVKLEGILRVKVNSKSAREKVVREERFALVTPFLNKYEVDEREPLPPYLCIVRFVISRSPAEVLESLWGKPFEAASLARLLDLCRAYPKKQFGYRTAFLGSYCRLGSNIELTGYPCLGETRDGARLLTSALDKRRFNASWHYALQPDSGEVVRELIRKIGEGRLPVRATAIA